MAGMTFTFFGTRTPRKAMIPVARTARMLFSASSSFSNEKHASSPSATDTSPSPPPTEDRRTPSEATTESRLAVDIGQLMRKDSEYSPKDIADFLHQLPHLDPKVVGRVLGEPDDLSLSILQEYANAFMFKEVSFDVALRVYLGRFILPGEAQKIDRILQAFAKAYHKGNARDKIIPTEDAAYTLAFSVVLLNTDAHNPHLAKKYKMGKDDFLRNHERLEVDMSPKFLRRLYDSFTNYPIQLLPRKDSTLLSDELELTFADGPLGLEIETSLDGRACVVKRYAVPPRHIYSTSSEIPNLSGYIVVAVADDCTRAVGYAVTRYLLKTAARPVTIRFCEPSVYFESMASD